MSESPFLLARRGGWAEDAALARSGPPYGPLNTYSNLAYAVVGGLLAWLDQGASGAAMAVAMILLATGSALYHSTKLLSANRIDWIGMYAVMGAATAHAWLPNVPAVGFLMLGAGAALSYWYGKKLKWISADWHMAALMVLSTIPIYWRNDHRSLLLASWLVFAVAYACWHLDRRKSRLVGLYGHACWHLLTALAIGLLYWAGRP